MASNVLITGGTGTLGKALVDHYLAHGATRVVVFSRDELKQSEMREKCADERLRFFIGDVRDLDRLTKAFRGVDTVIHAAALKQVPAAEYNPFEPVLTNIMGTKNVIDAAMANGVEKCMLVSTDKAVAPSTLYGATKMVAERLFVHANSYVGGRGVPAFSCVRYGNVFGSRGSFVDSILNSKSNIVPITDASATRFWITITQAVGFVTGCVDVMSGGEIFVPKLPSSLVSDAVRAILPSVVFGGPTGLRVGEKLHEILISRDERFDEVADYYVVSSCGAVHGVECSSSRRFPSLSADQFRMMLDDLVRR